MAKKDSLVKGTLILTLAALVARVLGVVQRIPLQYLIGFTGMATFSIAFNIYTPLLTVATAGIPSALSKLVSEKIELGQPAEAQRIYRASLQFAIAAGLVMTVALVVGAPYYADYVGDPDAAISIRALAPALLLFPVIAMMRGYFQGRRMMMPNGLSQIVEQIARLVTAVGLAYILLKAGWSEAWAIGGASFGGVMGSVGAVAVLMYYGARLKAQDEREGLGELMRQGQAAAAAIPYGRIYATIFKVSLPIVLFSLTVPLIYFIDSTITIKILRGSVGYEEAKRLLGILTSAAQSLAGIPIILAIALSQSIVPIISGAYAKRDLDTVRKQSAKALQLSILSGLPVVLAIAIAARPLNALLFKHEVGLDNGDGLISFLTVTALFQIVMQTTGSILMGLGTMRRLVLHVLIGLAIKLAGSFILTPFMGIYGIMTATALCFIVMMALNLQVLKQHVPLRLFSGRRWAGLGATTAAVVGLGVSLEQLTHRYVTWFPFKVDQLINSAVVGGVCVALYAVLLFVTRVYTQADLADMPGPLRKLSARLQRK